MNNKEQEPVLEADESNPLGDVRPKTNNKRAVKPLAGADFITATLLILFGIAFFIGARSMKVYQIFFTSPGFFPMILGVLFILFGITLLYTSYMRGGWIDARRIVSASNLKDSFTSPVFKKGGIVFLLIFGYVALLGKVSFVYLSMGYLLLTLLFLRAAKWYWIILISIVTPLAIHVAFVNFFRIPMP